jgi:hypothetical protein
VVRTEHYALALDPAALLDAGVRGDHARVLGHVERAVGAVLADAPPPVLLAVVMVVEGIVTERLGEILAVVDT